jgi:hypothetical protein
VETAALVAAEDEKVRLGKVSMQSCKVVFVFIDDDGGPTAYTKVRPIFANDSAAVGALGLTPKTYAACFGTLACYPSASGPLSMGSGLSVANALTMQSEGWEIASHSQSHAVGGYVVMSKAQKDADMLLAKTRFTEGGFAVNNLVYPFGAHDVETHEVAMKYYRSGVSVDTGWPAYRNVLPIASYSINRFAVDVTNVDPQSLNTLAKWKTAIDTAIASKSGELVVGMIHSGDTGHSGSQASLQMLVDILEYIQAQPGYGTAHKILTLNNALDLVGNLIESGPQNSPVRKNADYSDPTHSFDGVSHLPIPQFAVSKAGGVYAPNIGNVVHLPMLTDAGEVTGSWLSPEFPSFRTSIVRILTGTGFPAGSGTLITHRSSIDFGFDWQQFYVYGTAAVYTRQSLNGISWTAWKRLDQDTGIRRVISFDYAITAVMAGTIPACTSATNWKYFDIVNFPGAVIGTSNTVPGDTVIATPARHPEAGLLWRAYVFDTASVRFQLFNVSNAAISPTDRTWRIDILRNVNL